MIWWSASSSSSLSITTIIMTIHCNHEVFKQQMMIRSGSGERIRKTYTFAKIKSNIIRQYHSVISNHHPGDHPSLKSCNFFFLSLKILLELPSPPVSLFPAHDNHHHDDHSDSYHPIPCSPSWLLTVKHTNFFIFHLILSPEERLSFILWIHPFIIIFIFWSIKQLLLQSDFSSQDHHHLHHHKFYSFLILLYSSTWWSFRSVPWVK